MPYKRLEVEAIRDSVLAVSGQLNPKMFGPSMYPEIPPAALEGSSDPDKIWKAFERRGSVAPHGLRISSSGSMVVPMLDVLDLCDTARTAAKRQNTSVATQALTLFNGDFVNRQARYFAERLAPGSGRRSGESKSIWRGAWRWRVRPSRPRRPSMLDFLKREPLEQMCRVIFNLNEFVYAD